MKLGVYNLNIPISFDIIVLENKKNINNLTIILYNQLYSVNLVYNKKSVKINLESYSLRMNLNYNYNNNYNTKILNSYMKTFENYFFFKIKFKGKGFKIKFNKKLKLIKFYFGRSHITLFKLKKIKLKRVTKYKFVLKGLNLNKLKTKSRCITYIKPVNVYTLRGIRISRQFIKKRKGKKSSYI